MSCSGGEASLVADTAMPYDLGFRPYEPAEKTAISETLNPLVTVANPLDYHTFIWGDETALTETFTAAMAPGFDLSMLILDFPRDDRCSHETWEPAVNGIIAASERVKARTAIVASLPELLPEERCVQFMAAGLAPMGGIEDTLMAADAAASIGEAWEQSAPVPLAPMVSLGEGASETLSEYDGKHMLEKFGLQIPYSEEADDLNAAEEAAMRAGFPVAVKALGLAHKTEVGGVKLNLSDREQVHAEAAKVFMLSESIMIEKMVEGGIVEMIVGVTRDPVYGPMLTVGAGGVLAELLEDTVTLLLPVTDQNIRAAISGLKVSKLIEGYRGKPAADLDAVVAAVQSI